MTLWPIGKNCLCCCFSLCSIISLFFDFSHAATQSLCPGIGASRENSFRYSIKLILLLQYKCYNLDYKEDHSHCRADRENFCSGDEGWYCGENSCIPPCTPGLSFWSAWVVCCCLPSVHTPMLLKKMNFFFWRAGSCTQAR